MAERLSYSNILIYFRERGKNSFQIIIDLNKILFARLRICIK